MDCFWWSETTFEDSIYDSRMSLEVEFVSFRVGIARLIPVRSRASYRCAFETDAAFSVNQRNLFDENYGLASTQALKNKDIPEGLFVAAS